MADKKQTSNLVKGKTVVNSKTVSKEKGKMENEKASAEQSKARKVITLASVQAGLDEMIAAGLLPAEITALVEQGIVSAKLDQAEVEKGTLSGDYVRLALGENCKTDDDAIIALVAISGGNLRAPFKDAAEGEDAEADLRKPSLEKFALYGADLNARSRVSQRVRAAAEGPEKAIERMADQLQKAKPSLTREKAIAKAKAMLEDDDE